MIKPINPPQAGVPRPARMRFFMRYMAVRRGTISTQSWEEAATIELMEHTCEGAEKKALNILGAPPEFKEWFLRIYKIIEES